MLSPLPSNSGGGSIIIRYSDSCLAVADTAGTNISGLGNLPHPMKVASWAEQ